jgi:hypothetical protein
MDEHPFLTSTGPTTYTFSEATTDWTAIRAELARIATALEAIAKTLEEQG